MNIFGYELNLFEKWPYFCQLMDMEKIIITSSEQTKWGWGYIACGTLRIINVIVSWPLFVVALIWSLDLSGTRFKFDATALPIVSLKLIKAFSFTYCRYQKFIPTIYDDQKDFLWWNYYFLTMGISFNYQWCSIFFFSFFFGIC